MSLNRFAARRDANEPEIIRALRSIGAEVEQLDKPDLLVRFRGVNSLMEVSNPENRYRQREKDQVAFLQRFDIPVVQTVEQAFDVIGARIA